MGDHKIFQLNPSCVLHKKNMNRKKKESKFYDLNWFPFAVAFAYLIEKNIYRWILVTRGIICIDYIGKQEDGLVDG